MTIKVLRENVIKQLASIKEDNISIAGIAIERRKLLEALKLQTQDNADMLTINYGTVSWEYEYSNHSNGSWKLDPFKLEPQTCIQISCDHTTMRFMNHPKVKNWQEPKVIPLNFVDRIKYIKPILKGRPLDTQKLIDALTFVSHGMATDETRPPLACVLFESGDDTLKLVTADGFRLATAKFTVKGISPSNILINRLDIPKLLTFLKSNTEGTGKRKEWFDTHMQVTKKTVKFMSEKSMVELDKQPGTFPDYSKLIPKDGTKNEFIASDMLRAVKALSNIANEGSGIIRLHFNTGEPCGKITLFVKSEDYGESRNECDALVESDCKIAVNHKYLLDLLKQCGDARIAVMVTNPSSPMLFDISDTRQEVVMPMFVQWGDKE